MESERTSDEQFCCMGEQSKIDKALSVISVTHDGIAWKGTVVNIIKHRQGPDHHHNNEREGNPFILTPLPSLYSHCALP